MLIYLCVYSWTSTLQSVITLFFYPPGQKRQRKYSYFPTLKLLQRYSDSYFGIKVKTDISFYPQSLGYSSFYTCYTGKYLIYAPVHNSFILFQLFSTFPFRQLSSSFISSSLNKSALLVSDTKSLSLQWWSSRIHLAIPFCADLSWCMAEQMLRGIQFLEVDVMSFYVLFWGLLYFLQSLAYLSFFSLSYSSFSLRAYSLVFSFCFFRNSSMFSNFWAYLAFQSFSPILPYSIFIYLSNCSRFLSFSLSSFANFTFAGQRISLPLFAFSNLNFFIKNNIRSACVKWQAQVYFQPYLFTNMIWVNRLPNILTFSKRMLYLFSNQPNKQSSLLCSQFHFKGIRHFQKSRQLTRSSALFQIDKLVTQLQKKRQKTLQLKALQMRKEDQQLGNKAEYISYVETYEKLVQKVREIKIGEEWAYRMIGWYNMQPYLQLLIEQLISKADKSQYQLLIESINWMHPHQLTLNTEQSIQEVMKHKTKIDHFYKHLNYGYPISTLKQIQSILGSTMTQIKSKYYHHYTLNNCPNILKATPPSNEELEDILWLLEMYVTTYNDSPQVIRQFEDYLLLHKTDLSKTATTFIKIYNQLGRANPQVYRHFIKPLLASNPYKIIDAQIVNLEFLIHSQINDAQALNETFKNIAKLVRTQPISQGHRLHIHYLMHYLKIKNIPFNFPFSIARDFTQTCRNFEEDATLAKQMAIQLDQKSRREGVEYYNSNCVLKKKNFEGKANVGEQIKKVQGFKKYKNIKFCCLNIDLCVYDPSSKKAVVLQKNYHRFNHSGRLVRMEQVKEVILKHYGFDVNYLQTKYEQSKRSQA